MLKREAQSKVVSLLFPFFSEGGPCSDVYAVLVPIWATLGSLWDPFEFILVDLGSNLISIGRIGIHFGIPVVALGSISAGEMCSGATYDPNWSLDAPRPDPH
jgi:hypothetical protein